MKNYFEEKIKNTKLTTVEKKIAEYILENYSNICFRTAVDISNDIGVSDSSVIRLSRKLGYTGYSDMQKFMQEYLQGKMEENEIVNLLPPAKRLLKKIDNFYSNDFYDKILIQTTENIRAVFEKNSKAKFDEASRIIIESKRKFVMGFRGCSGLAELIGGSIGDMLSDVRINTQADSRAIECMMDIDSEDCLIISGFPRYSKMAVLMAEMAVKSSAKVIALTDKVTSPIAQGASVVIVASINSITVNNSYTAPTLAGELLVANVSSHVGSSVKERLETLEGYISKTGLY